MRLQIIRDRHPRMVAPADIQLHLDVGRFLEKEIQPVPAFKLPEFMGMG